MQRIIYAIDNLDCAHCAAQIEEKIAAHPQVEAASITFATKQLRVTAKDPNALLPELLEIARKIEPEVVIRSREAQAASVQKIYTIENLDCAHCAAQIEERIAAHPQVEAASITFATKQLRVTARDPDALLPELLKIAQKTEKDVQIRPVEDRAVVHHHAHGCDCGDHHHAHGCGCDEHPQKDACSCGEHHHESACDHVPHHHAEETPKRKWLRVGEPEFDILAGSVLFVLGLLLEHGNYPLLTLGASILAYAVLGIGVVRKAVQNLFRGRMMDENFLMSVASIGAFLVGNYTEAVGVMLFYRVGEFFEEKAVIRSRGQIMEAVDLRPDVVNLVEGDEVRMISARDARVGDLLLVRPGDRIPLDGIVVSGDSRVDTAPITGEPVPVHVKPGDLVTSGCVNTSGQLHIRAERELSQSMVTRILDSVENAAASKPKIDRFITRFARYYTPVVVAVALGTALVPPIFTGNWNYWVYTALTFLVMSCPCALVLSVPLAFFSGIGAGSKQGILFKGGTSMEALGKVRTVIMDKTGTITKGEFKVRKILGDRDLLRICASCEQQSSHPIAVSIVAAAREQGMELSRPQSLEEISGKGLRAKLDGRDVLCGNAALLTGIGIQVPRSDQNGTRVLVAVDGSYRGEIIIDDVLKDTAVSAVQWLKRRGIHTVMLTGDREPAARAVADAAGIDQLYAGLLPHEKLEKLQQIREQRGAVMFVGDGINDAPVLAGADVGAAMGSGADAAIEAADVVFMTSDPEAIPQALTIAAKTAKIAWMNVIFALVVKLIAMLLGLCGYASMWLAVFADTGVAMICILNSIRLLYHKK